MILNFLFAFDKNYNTQASVSIYSLLENLENKVNIYVILDKSNNNLLFPQELRSHRNLNKLIIKEIDIDEKFYNVEIAHVSKATFYRLYISSLFENEEIKLTYLDSDIICTSNPSSSLITAFSNMEKEGKSVAFADEFYRHENEEPFLRLLMKSQKYFNAGVMLVDLKKWNSNNYTEKSIDLIAKLKNKAKFWDQDILNSMIDGDYLTISNNLNYRTSKIGIKTEIGDKCFIHYAGKSKPWDVGGAYEEFSLIYHLNYQKLFGRQFHVTSKNRKNSIKKLFRYLIHFNTISFTSSLKYFLQSIITIIKK